MDSWSYILAFVILLVTVLTVVGIWYSVSNHGSSYYREKPNTPADETLVPPPPVIYGAWQGHAMGTTTMEPGDLTRLEDELREADEDKEE